MDWVPPASFDEYRLVKALGRGSMGQVWLAHDTVLDRPVAVKFLAALPAHDVVHQRFLTEARAAARVQHPNIIAVYRVGEVGLRPYLISEYVRGDSLDKIARPVAWPRLLELAIGLARGLAAAHGHGVLHRDLKPANAIVSETGEVKLLDFGLAKLLPHKPPHTVVPPDRERMAAAPGFPGEWMVAPHVKGASCVGPPEQDARTIEVVTGAEATLPGGGITLAEGTPPWLLRARESRGLHPAIAPWPSVTCAGATMGTPSYMPPEAWRGEPATPRSDVYSLGALLYELGAGAPPHRGDSQEAVRESALATDALSLAIAAPGIDPGFAEIIDRCLRRDPTERFASGDEVRQALEALAAGDDTTAIVRARPVWRRPAPHLKWVVVIAAALAVARFAYHRTGGERSPAPVATAVAKDALPDAPAQDVSDAAGSRPIGAAGRCPEEMVPVPAGTFLMGSPEGQGDPDEHPQHAVTLPPYCIDTTEVTVAAYAACVANRGCSAAPLTTNLNVYSAKEVKDSSRLCNRNDRPDHPINCVNWHQAAAYCTWQGKRLPTEAEWEYAARGKDDRVYPWGNEAPNGKRLNMCGGKCVDLATREVIPVATVPDGNGFWETTPVGSYPAGRSAFGAFDMAGNVAEWTADWYGSYAAQAEINPHGPSTGTSRVTRGGGGWANIHTNRAAGRDWPDPADRAVDLGFRCARGR